ncbi:OB-fold nucleic acid binding domain-containing protein [Kineosporia mesophila]|uniref:OB-fold nucleic acid binding domain-containing protein n=1 Tax=Kineosporia mesophila TaxID=566012 RepID=UPI001E535490|nr:OB-fold nucleic acid binding domain-containing protein [Kineosporia mesophila]
MGKQITGDQATIASVENRAAERFGLRRALAKFTAPQHVVHADEEREQAVRLGGTPIAQLKSRQPAMVCGTLRAVTLRPRAGVPALVAELYDGSGSISVIWLGRRHIGGVEPGRRIRVQGVVCEASGTATIFNPRYELVPGTGS